MAYLWSFTAAQCVKPVLHAGGVLIHKQKEGEFILRIWLQFLEQLTYPWVGAVIEEGPHFDDVLVDRKLKEDVVFILKRCTNLE